MALTGKFGTDIAVKDNKRGKLKFEDMSEITKIIQFNSMMDETERIKKYMRENVRGGKCEGEYTINLSANLRYLNNLDKEILNKMINISMDDFCFFTLDEKKEKLTTFDFAYADVFPETVVLKFRKILPLSED